MSRHVSRRPSRKASVDLQPVGAGEVQKGQGCNQVYGHTGGAGKSRTNLRDNLGSRNASRKDVSSKGSRPVCEIPLAVAETVVGLDLSRDLDEDDDEGKYWSKARRDNRGASRMSFFSHSLSVPDTGGGSALNVDDRQDQGDKSQGPTRGFLRSVISQGLMTSDRHEC